MTPTNIHVRYYETSAHRALTVINIGIANGWSDRRITARAKRVLRSRRRLPVDEQGMVLPNTNPE